MADEDDRQPVDPDTEDMLKEAEVTIDSEKPEVSEDTQEPETKEVNPETEAVSDDRPASEEPSVEEKAPDTLPESAAFQSKKWYRNKRILVLATILVLSAAAAAYFLVFNKQSEDAAEAPEQEQVNSVARFGVAVGLAEGTVEFSKDGNTWTALSAESDLVESDHVRTGDGAKSVLLIDDGSAIRLNANTHVQLISLAVDDVRIANESGDVYSRVVSSDDRRFAVYVAGDMYEARGTAYRAVNTEDKKGVEVYHSKVAALNKDDPGKDVEVSEGNAYFTVNPEENKKNTVSAIDLDELKNDEFIKWCAEQDKKEPAFIDKLGVLVDIDKPKEEPTPPQPQTSNGITLGVTQTSDYSVRFSWTVKGINTSQGFKLVRSSKTQTPTYPDNGVVFIDTGKTSYELYDKDGGTYYYRICAYRGKTCDSYSNAVSATTKKKEKELAQSGTISLTVSVDKLTWSDTGTAPHGYKVLTGTSSGPTVDSHYKKYGASSPKYKFSDMHGLNSGTTYYFKVCRIQNDGSCQDLSNEVSYDKP